MTTLAASPFLVLAGDGSPLVERKQGIVLYLPAPPTREVVRRIYELWMDYAGDRMRFFRPTTPGHFPEPWTPESRSHFESVELDELYRYNDWGWMFSDGQPTDAWTFVFHAYRPFSEPGKSSFFRFDFDADVNTQLMRSFAARLIETTPFTSGFGGYWFQGRADLRFLSASYDAIYALAHRYAGIEAHNLDVTVEFVGDGFKCVNWLTFIGAALAARRPETIALARAAAAATLTSPLGWMFQATPAPLVGDRNRSESLDGYRRVGVALEPLQIVEHGSFGGDRWTDENVMDYLRRFT